MIYIIYIATYSPSIVNNLNSKCELIDPNNIDPNSPGAEKNFHFQNLTTGF